MSRNVQLVILCEDRQQETFIRRFLEKRGWPSRGLRVEKAPKGHGSGEQYVRQRFPLELKEHRRSHVARALMIMIDGDDQGVDARFKALNTACADSGIRAREDDEPVAIFVPTWRIETWLAYLDGQTVDETERNYPRLERPRECRRHVDALAEMCADGKLRQPAPPSLEAACEEYNARIAHLRDEL